MKLKDYLIKKAYTGAPKETTPETVRMNTYFNAAAANAGYKVPGQAIVGIDAPGGYTGMGVLDDKVVPYVFANNASPAILSHEQGHVHSGHASGLTAALRATPIVGDVATLVGETQANNKSWNMLKKMYGDDPALLEAIKKDRQKVLPRGFSTYVAYNGLPLATTVVGGYLGYNRYKKSKKKIEEQRKQLLNNNSLSKEEINKRLSALKDPSKFRNIAGGAAIGYGGGKLLGLGINSIFNSAKSFDDLTRQSEKYGKEVGIENMMREHAKRHGYYKPEFDTDRDSGVYNINAMPESINL